VSPAIICLRCGKEVALGSRFCGHCGAQASDPESGTIILTPEDPDALLTRLRLVFAGEYDVEEELGRGGMAAVFKAVEIPLKRQVALKVLLPEMGITPATVERFKREAYLWPASTIRTSSSCTGSVWWAASRTSP
jgi:serine/threonine protein kinase